eukprot:UN11687
MRLLRFVKFESRLQEQLRRFNSLFVLSVYRILKVLGLFLMLNHFFACTWYFIGSSSNGWLAEQVIANSAMNDVESGYFLALHWPITQFHGSMELSPSSLTERKLTVVALIIGLLTTSAFVSFITDMIFQVSMARKRQTQQT